MDFTWPEPAPRIDRGRAVWRVLRSVVGWMRTTAVVASGAWIAVASAGDTTVVRSGHGDTVAWTNVPSRSAVVVRPNRVITSSRAWRDAVAGSALPRAAERHVHDPRWHVPAAEQAERDRTRRALIESELAQARDRARRSGSEDDAYVAQALQRELERVP